MIWHEKFKSKQNNIYNDITTEKITVGKGDKYVKTNERTKKLHTHVHTQEHTDVERNHYFSGVSCT